MEVYVDDEAKLTLHGLQQHYVKLKENEKNKKLFDLLDILEFNQVKSIGGLTMRNFPDEIVFQIVSIVPKSPFRKMFPT